MDDNNKTSLYEYIIPDNILSSKRILGFRRRNWIEGLIMAFAVGALIYFIPFVTRVKIIFIVCICLPILIINLIGIRDQSFTEAILNIKQAKINAGHYHLRSPGYEKRTKSGMDQSTGGGADQLSAADKILAAAKEWIKAFKETHG